MKRNSALRPLALGAAVAALIYFAWSGALGGALRTLGENGSFVREAVSFELDAAQWGETDGGQDTADALLIMRHAALSSLDGAAESAGSGLEGAAQTAGKTVSAAGTAAAQPAASAVTLTGAGFDNRTAAEVDLSALPDVTAAIDLSLDGPKVLIYHTHGSEAYTPEGDDIYIPTDPSRTENGDYNMLRIGREVQRVLEQNGIECIQADELHDYPSYTGSYARSLETVQEYLAAYPSIQVVLDLHRDALEGDGGAVLKTVAELESSTEPTAQLLLVVGSDGGGLEHPNWRQNLSFALALQSELDSRYPTLARPLSLRDARFNQQVLPRSLLVEIGTSGNTLQEALRCARLFALVLSNALT